MSPEDQTKGPSALPLNSFSLIEDLDKRIPKITVDTNDLLSEVARLKLAEEIGRRKLVDDLLLRAEAATREMRARKES